MDYGQRDEYGGEQALAPPIQPRAQNVDEGHRGGVGECGERPADDSQVVDFDARHGGEEAVEALEHVEGEAAVWEPSRVQGTAVGVEEVPHVAGAGEARARRPS